MANEIHRIEAIAVITKVPHRRNLAWETYEKDSPPFSKQGANRSIRTNRVTFYILGTFAPLEIIPRINNLKAKPTVLECT